MGLNECLRMNDVSYECIYCIKINKCKKSGTRPNHILAETQANDQETISVPDPQTFIMDPDSDPNFTSTFLWPLKKNWSIDTFFEYFHIWIDRYMFNIHKQNLFNLNWKKLGLRIRITLMRIQVRIQIRIQLFTLCGSGSVLESSTTCL